MCESPKDWYLRKYKETGDENYLKMFKQQKSEPKSLDNYLKEPIND